MPQIEATKKIIADLQSVLFEADSRLDKVSSMKPNLESICKTILHTFMVQEPTDKDIEYLKVMLKTMLTSHFQVDINKF